MGGYAPGASDGFGDAHSALRELVMAATVRIHRAGVGYALDEPGTFLGSGFFVAPNWVLTCAHVPRSGKGGEVTVVYEADPGRGATAVAGEVAATLPEHAGLPAQGAWPAPDLALVRLREPVDHECVYLSERPAAYYSESKVFYAGWTVLGGQLVLLDGPLSVHGGVRGASAGVQMRLGDNDLPLGVSGGPVVDPERGEVVGILKSRSDRGSGGTSMGVEQLRTLPVPRGEMRAEHDDLYQAVLHAHDRYHRDRQRHADSVRPTWADAQSQLRARPGRTLSPVERVELLGRLADLPPPVSTRSLLDILDSLPDHEAAVPAPAPRGWRDGLGALYANARQDGALKLFLDYVVGVLFAERPFSTPGTQDAERALWEWVHQAALGLSSKHRSRFARLRTEWIQQRSQAPKPPRHGQPGQPAEVPDPARMGHEEAPAGGALRRTALLELLERGWQRDHCDWRVSVVHPGGEIERLDEAEQAPLDRLSEHLAGALDEAFRQCDEGERPAVLQVALPHALLGVAVDDWQLAPGEPPLGTYRPVVVRSADRDQLFDEGEFWPFERDRAHGAGDAYDPRDAPGTHTAHDAYAARSTYAPHAPHAPHAAHAAHNALAPHDPPHTLHSPHTHDERESRWYWVHAHAAKGEVLDCDDGLRIPVPTVNRLRGLHPGAVPVLCRHGDQRFEDDTMALARIVHGGFGVALWRRWSGGRDAVCGEFHRRAGDTVAVAGGADRLPELVRTLRAGVRAGRPETFWADGIALLYDDPHQPLPGTGGDLLEAP
ncbi:VMAP-C domain-containing protein [Streptomyces acidicola]|uniref:VMAP-C domain-containing protein n=1 Tax=Streptomyces acidicola TaxID=2596892 RepID=UPI0038142362